MRFAAGDHLRAFGDGVGNVFFNFGDGFLVDQRAGRDALLQAVADAQFFHRLLQLLGETVIHPVWTYRRLAQTQVCPALRNFEASAPSTALSRSASSKTINGALPPSSRRLFDVFRALLHQLAANLGRAGKGELAHQRVTGQFAADRAG